MLAWAMLIGSIMTYAASNDYYAGRRWIEFAAVIVLGIVGVLATGYNIYQQERTSTVNAVR
ncbi:MAG: hypothetical protein M3P30_04725 [Chloroflexota bacterium]|nr:hypothetical protein [Chloroflexota bacterium]